jgi:hypothetical protein
MVRLIADLSEDWRRLDDRIAIVSAEIEALHSRSSISQRLLAPHGRAIHMAQPSPSQRRSPQWWSFAIVNGSDLDTASVAVMSVRSWGATALPLLSTSPGLDDFK